MLSGLKGKNNNIKYFLKKKKIYRDKNNDNNLKAGIYFIPAFKF